MPTKGDDREHLALLQQQISDAHAPRDQDVRALTAVQRRTIVDTFRRLVEGMYAHLPQKRATYGFDPSQRLRLLGERAADLSLPDATFHREMAQILTDLRDAHTRYLAPRRYANEACFLPILVERYVDAEGAHYVASKVKSLRPSEEKQFAGRGFVDGVELKYWNGVPIERAVDLYAASETGGRPDARLARALESLTIRPLRYALPPEEEWVDIVFQTKRQAVREIRLHWQTIALNKEPPPPTGSAGQALAYNPTADSARQVKKMLFAGNVWVAERNLVLQKESELRPEATTRSRKPTATDVARSAARDARSAVQVSYDNGWSRRRDQPLTGAFASSVYAKEVKLTRRRFGYLRIHSFQVHNDQAFIEEVIELVEHMPRSGLIVDLRTNPGGNIWAAEGLLQLFTPHPITPTRFSMLATDMTRAMATAPQNRNMQPWAESLRAAMTTGVSHSRSEPLTPVARCNNFGQRYCGPVVAVVDANTYSAGDLFAAGFVDNHIGKLICTDQATGGGGANVWTPDIVQTALKGTGFELPDLGEVSFTISARRAERSGAESLDVEDAGVESVFRRPLTRDDLVHNNRDLLAYACRHLANEEPTEMDYEVTTSRTPDGTEVHSLAVGTVGLSHVRVKYDGMTRLIGPQLDLGPAASGQAKRQQQVLRLERDWTQYRVDLMGYDRTRLRQRRLIVPPANVTSRGSVNLSSNSRSDVFWLPAD